MKVVFYQVILALLPFSIFSQNHSLDFDGIDDYVTMGDLLDLGTSDFTIEAWIYIEGTATWNKIINKGLTNVGTPVNSGYGLRTGFPTADAIDFTMTNFNQQFIRLQYSGISFNSWNHLAAVRNGPDVQLFVNGIQVDSDNTITTYNVNTNIPFAIGALHRGPFGVTSEVMDGKIDEVRIWNIARTSVAIQDDMNRELMGTETGLLAYYNFNEGVPNGNNAGVTMLPNITSSSFNGQLENFALIGDHSNWVGQAPPIAGIEIVPTLGQWAVIILALLLMICCILFIKQKLMVSA